MVDVPAPRTHPAYIYYDDDDSEDDSDDDSLNESEDSSPEPENMLGKLPTIHLRDDASVRRRLEVAKRQPVNRSNYLRV